ncbi:ABC transporter family substrate-binding protein [Rhodococcus wratislaviensis]|uniref:Putative ABC transporter substrate-binding protein n=1 Tax=Rhodococcus wratislaviensis NBRC 100605 TaxID=1219028 RepID=X0PV25_RHOWR|nr:ABC transporter family substrate-binding protein [Rhodococcus wratislaviensis]GAF47028.1 putative ABC transporter substrate-binding protein [Rhodococcus wratislaviensis NBRC 100605]
MRIRSARTRLAVSVLALGLVLGGCGGSDTGDVEAGSGSIGTTNDINPHDPSELRDGGNLRLALSGFPPNFNTLSNDGNDTEIGAILKPMMPRAFSTDASGALSVNHDYFTDVALTGTDPQQVTYTIDPKAVWSDGTPITWADIQSQAAALSGENKDFLIANTSGFERVDRVERGVDDRQAVITFAEPYAEWKGQFAGNSMLYPKSVTATPEAFNESLRDGVTLTSGPFRIVSIDRAQNRITLGRNPVWWGNTPKLDTITYSVLDDAARIPALQNNEIDASGLGTIDEVKTAQGSAGIAIRRAPGNQFSHITFNGAEGSILADPELRVALSKGIDRQGIATAIQNGLVDDPQPLNNHVYLNGQEGYQDNSAAVSYDPEEAARRLDELGWKLNGEFREKDGRRLEIRDVMYQSTTWVQIAQILQQNLAQIGAKLNIDTRGGTGFFTDVIQPGDFDIAQFSWVGDPFPLSGLPQIYAYNPDDLQGNYGRIGSPELNALIERTISELDPQKAIELANEVDTAVFEEGFSLPLVQAPGNVAVRDNLANFGAAGLASYDYTTIGFLN